MALEDARPESRTGASHLPDNQPRWIILSTRAWCVS